MANQPTITYVLSVLRSSVILLFFLHLRLLKFLLVFFLPDWLWVNVAKMTLRNGNIHAAKMVTKFIFLQSVPSVAGAEKFALELPAGERCSIRPTRNSFIPRLTLMMVMMMVIRAGVESWQDNPKIISKITEYITPVNRNRNRIIIIISKIFVSFENLSIK